MLNPTYTHWSTHQQW